MLIRIFSILAITGSAVLLASCEKSSETNITNIFNCYVNSVTPINSYVLESNGEKISGLDFGLVRETLGDDGTISYTLDQSAQEHCNNIIDLSSDTINTVNVETTIAAEVSTSPEVNL